MAQEFNVVPIRFSKANTAEHQLFIKEHSVQNCSSDKPSGKTIICLNVPPYATEKSFKQLFSKIGTVNKVLFQQSATTKDELYQKLIKSFHIAFIVFEDSISVSKALKVKALEFLSNENVEIVTSIKKWTMEYNNQICDHKKLQESVVEFMQNYDKIVEQEKEREKAGKVDDDGWTVVTKHNRRSVNANKESVNDKVKNKLNRSKKKKELKNFYTFQIRESKMKQLASLRMKYEEDQKKIAAMKQARRFKPF